MSVVGDGGCEAVHNNRAGATVSLDIPDIAEAETGRAKGMPIDPVAPLLPPDIDSGDGQHGDDEAERADEQ
ncbi:hypothetical protein [Methylocapsa aurea]|uniref:hypothetical protein n=1 Tax=Methylocapsa aurea TaxID=663610 RepID=UPI003D18CF57